MPSNELIKILLIDDIEDDYYLLRHLLAKIKSVTYQLDLCLGSDKAYSYLTENTYDLYLIEFKLEKCNGIELLKKAKRNGLNKPAIMLAMADIENLEIDAIATGYCDFLPKLQISALFLERTLRYAIEKNLYTQEIKQRELELESLLKFRELTTSISRKFIVGHGDTLDERVLLALGELGEFLKVGRCRVYELKAGDSLMTYKVWQSQDMALCRDELYDLEKSSYPILMNKISENLTLSIDGNHKSNLWETEIYEFVKSIGIEHLVILPLFFQGEWLGALALESKLPLRFSEAEWTLIELVSDILGDVMERRESEITLQNAREEALKASRIKTEFLSNMSHELRTPLNAILGMTDVLNESELGKDQREYLSILNKAAVSLKFIFDDIFEYAHLDSRPKADKVSSFHLEDLIRAKIFKFKKMAESSIELSYQMQCGLPVLGEGDQEKLSRVLDHLLSNAVKFTQKGKINVEVKSFIGKSDYIEITVQDTGVGIAKSDLNKIFDCFFQIDTSLTRPYSGTGLGLTIVKRMLELLECDISIVSTLAVGTSVTFTFPFDVQKVAIELKQLHA